MKVDTEVHLDELFYRKFSENTSEHIDLIEIKPEGMVSHTFLIVRSVYRDNALGMLSERSYQAFDTEIEAYAWLDENGFDLLV